MTPSRLRIDPTTLLPTATSFEELGDFLRDPTRDEEASAFGESMRGLAGSVEAIVEALKPGRERERVAPMLVDLLTVLREHRAQVVGLGPSWRTLYEYPAYLAALNNFRLLIGQWLTGETPEPGQLPPATGDFEQVAWRTLGEGMLLIDMYDQWRAGSRQEDSLQDPPAPARVRRALHWWEKLRR